MHAPDHHPAQRDSVTDLLAAWRAGDEAAPRALAELVYADLRTMASRRLAGGGPLQTTELAHEACLRLLQKPLDAVDRVHFFRTVALALRQALIDALRREHAQKRGSGFAAVSLDAAAGIAVAGPEAWFGVESALLELEALDARKCRVVEMSLLLGLVQDEIAQTLGISVPTVERDLRFARAWLRERLAA
ncbi:MAG: RNA polymerase subunit sigma-24 [Proteobacteria bacterium]|uniref:ECF-type sigma factor n=1 Tax=Rudaea sp. TaxID=2136325 RepID=UPI00321FD7D4|nr:RNA polymerase subunit sigma-24 [Pseudomonadota bacterium]